MGITSKQQIEINLDEGFIGRRLDQAITDTLEGEYSRARIQEWIKGGQLINQVSNVALTQASLKLKTPLSLILTIPEVKPSTIEAENIPLDIVYEDDDLLVINKPAGLVVHPGAGNWDGTLVNGLLYHCKDSLSGIGGVERPGIVHRLDKETSGLMVVAKNDDAHQGLSEDLAQRRVKRLYWAFVWGVPMPPADRVETLYGRDPYNRLKMAVLKRDGKEAITDYRVLERFDNELYSLVECQLQTGRTHQIRVHLQHIGHPLIGEPLYAKEITGVEAGLRNSDLDEERKNFMRSIDRQALHAKELHFIHPLSGEEMFFETDLPDDLNGLCSKGE